MMSILKKTSPAVKMSVYSHDFDSHELVQLAKICDTIRYEGRRATGKTSALAYIAVNAALWTPRRSLYYASPTLKKGTEFLQIVKKLVEKISLDLIYSESKFQIVFVNGSSIKTGTIDSCRGLTHDLVISEDTTDEDKAMIPVITHNYIITNTNG